MTNEVTPNTNDAYGYVDMMETIWLVKAAKELDPKNDDRIHAVSKLLFISHIGRLANEIRGTLRDMELIGKNSDQLLDTAKKSSEQFRILHESFVNNGEG